MHSEYVTLNGERIVAATSPAGEAALSDRLCRLVETLHTGSEALLDPGTLWEEAVRHELQRSGCTARDVELHPALRMAQDIDLRLRDRSHGPEVEPLDRATRVVEGLIAEARSHFKSSRDVDRFLRENHLIRAGSESRPPSRTKIYRILSGDQNIQARELIALLTALGYVVHISNARGGPLAPDLSTPVRPTRREDELVTVRASRGSSPAQAAFQVEASRMFGWMQPDDQTRIARTLEAHAVANLDRRVEARTIRVHHPLTALGKILATSMGFDEEHAFVQWSAEGSQEATGTDPVSEAIRDYWRAVARPRGDAARTPAPSFCIELASSRRRHLQSADLEDSLSSLAASLIERFTKEGGLLVSSRIYEALRGRSTAGALKHAVFTCGSVLDPGRERSTSAAALLIVRDDCRWFAGEVDDKSKWTCVGILPSSLAGQPSLLYLPEKRIADLHLGWAETPLSLLHESVVTSAWRSLANHLGATAPDLTAAPTPTVVSPCARLLAPPPPPPAECLHGWPESSDAFECQLDRGEDALAPLAPGWTVLARSSDFLPPCPTDRLTMRRRDRLAAEVAAQSGDSESLLWELITVAAPETVRALARIVGALCKPRGEDEWDVGELAGALGPLVNARADLLGTLTGGWQPFRSPMLARRERHSPDLWRGTPAMVAGGTPPPKHSQRTGR